MRDKLNKGKLLENFKGKFDISEIRRFLMTFKNQKIFEEENGSNFKGKFDKENRRLSLL